MPPLQYPTLLARFRDHRSIEHRLHPVAAGPHLAERRLAAAVLAIEARAHRQQVFDGETLFASVAVLHDSTRKRGEYRLIDVGELAIADRHPNQGRRHALGHRRDVVELIRLKREEDRIENQIAVAHDREAVNAGATLADVVEGVGEHRRVQALRFRRRPAPFAGRPVGGPGRSAHLRQVEAPQGHHRRSDGCEERGHGPPCHSR